MTGFDWHLANWLLWCRRRDWLPMGHVSQIATLIKQAKQESLTATNIAIPVYEPQALQFNELVSRLPRRHMQIFLLNHLDKGVLGQIIVYTRHASTKYKLAGVSRTTFYDRAKEADNMIKRWIA